MIGRQEDPIVSLYRDSFPDFARMVRRMGGSPEQAKDSFHDALETAKASDSSSIRLEIKGTGGSPYPSLIKRQIGLRPK